MVNKIGGCRSRWNLEDKKEKKRNEVLGIRKMSDGNYIGVIIVTKRDGAG